MATYRLYTKCEYCDQRHPLPFGFSMDRLMQEEGCLIDIFKKQKPPKAIISIINNRSTCPNTGKVVHKSDPNRIYIVPTGDIRAK